MENQIIQAGINPDTFEAEGRGTARLPWHTPGMTAFQVSKTLANTHPGLTYDADYNVSDS